MSEDPQPATERMALQVDGHEEIVAQMHSRGPLGKVWSHSHSKRPGRGPLLDRSEYNRTVMRELVISETEKKDGGFHCDDLPTFQCMCFSKEFSDKIFGGNTHQLKQ